MARRRFFVEEVRNGHAELLGEDAQHLARVLRAEPGQRFELSDNRSAYLAEIVELRKERVTFRILEGLPPESPAARITLFACLIKFDRLEWMIEKTTELGVHAILPVHAARSEKGLLAAAQKRVERWRRIARESSQQSRRVRIPEILAPQQLASAMRTPSAYSYFLDEAPQATPVLHALPPEEERKTSDELSLFVGPEGGWTPAERAGLTTAHWTGVSLGPYTLRSETAAAAGLAVLANAWRTVS